MGLKLIYLIHVYHKSGFVGHSMKQYVNYLCPDNHKFDRELITLKLLLGLFLNVNVYVFDNAYDMIFEIVAGLIKALCPGDFC